MVGVTLDERLIEAETSLDSSTKAGDAVRERGKVSAQHQHTNHGKLRYHGEASVEELPAAGLSSDRCTRDFATCCNRRLHSGTKQPPIIRVSTTYEQKRPRELELDWIIKHGDSMLPCGVTANAGTTDKKSSIQLKLLEHYVRYNRVHSVPQTQEKQSEVTDCSLRECDANRIRNMQHCCIFNDVDDTQRSAKKQDLDPRTFTLAEDTTTNTVVRMDEECLSGEDSTQSMPSVETEVTIIGGLRAVNKKDPEWEIVSFRMSGIKSSFTEKDFEVLARKANMQVVSVNLDRNIITHLCNGTGNMRCRHTGGERGLMHFSRLLAKNGIRLYITDIISKSDVIKRPSQYATAKS